MDGRENDPGAFDTGMHENPAYDSKYAVLDRNRNTLPFMTNEADELTLSKKNLLILQFPTMKVS